MKKNAFYALGFAAAILMGTTACNNAANKEDSVDTANKMNEAVENNPTTTASQDDADFAVKAANAGMSEIESSKVALAGSANAGVKSYAQMIVDEHTAAGTKLGTIATSKQITVPATLGDDEKNKVADLSKKKGTDLDKAYLDKMVSDHKDAVDLFKKESDNSKDADLKAFAGETLPTLQKHLDEAKALRDKIK